MKLIEAGQAPYRPFQRSKRYVPRQVLKRQRAHMEAAKVLSFTEDTIQKPGPNRMVNSCKFRMYISHINYGHLLDFFHKFFEILNCWMDVILFSSCGCLVDVDPVWVALLEPLRFVARIHLAPMFPMWMATVVGASSSWTPKFTSPENDIRGSHCRKLHDESLQWDVKTLWWFRLVTPFFWLGSSFMGSFWQFTVVSGVSLF